MTSPYGLLKKLYFRLCIEQQSYFYEKEGIRLCDAVVTLSKSRAEEIVAYYGLDSKRVHVVPYDIGQRAREACEKRFNWQACAVKLLDIYKKRDK